MHSTKIITITTLLSFAFTVPLAGCGRGSKGDARDKAVVAVEACDSIPSPVKKLVRAVADNDSDGFAALVSYPLQRPYPLRDIRDADEMKKYYRELVDDSLRKVITTSGPEKWSEYGWRGWTLDDGRYIWVDDDVYDVQYISQKELKAIDSLSRREVETMAPSLRQGWLPTLCLRDDTHGTVYRIDKRTRHDRGQGGHHYRLAVYGPGSDLREIPAQLLEGLMENEGTAGTVIYRFHDRSGAETIIEPDAPDTPSPILVTPSDSTIELTRAYWHELVEGN